MSNQRRLGRGLEALLGRSLDDPNATPESLEGQFIEAAPASDASTHDGMDRDYNGQLWLDVVSIDTNPHQPRKEFDEVEIADLADSIRAHGVIQPLVVRQVDQRFQLIAGERRLRAAQAAGWERVPVLVKDVTDQQLAELAIVENIQRKDLSPLEKAASFQKYLMDYNCTQEDLAQRIHIDRSTIANLIRLLELPEQVKKLLSKGDISQGHARALLPLGDEEQQIDFAYRIKAEGLSVRATESAVQDALAASADGLLDQPAGDAAAPAAKPTRSEQIAFLEQEFKTALGTKVALSQNAKGKGKVTIHFADADEFERIRTVLLATQQLPQPTMDAPADTLPMDNQPMDGSMPYAA